MGVPEGEVREKREREFFKKYDRKLTKFGERYEYKYPKSTINCKMNKIHISYR